VGKENLRGRWALILGASSGFGAATARALADPSITWISGTVIGVDGGEFVAG
jgi:NADP-dependent 3-hydroxy acid dehydrogenase YdfG